MRNLKKLVALIVTIALMATLAIPAFAATPKDVVGTDYEGAVTRLVALGVITGYPDGNFGPNDTITRAQFAAVVVRSLGYETIAETAKGVTKFSDVAANYWGAGYINLAVSLGVIKGYGDGKFGPEDKVTFEQAVTMVVRALGQEFLAEQKGGFPTGYLLQGKSIGFTDGVKGVAGTAATRGVVAQLVDNAKDENIYIPSTSTTGVQGYVKTDDTFLTKLGMTPVKDVIVTKTPATGGDADKLTAGGTIYPVVSGTFDIESVLGKKVTLWKQTTGDKKVVLAQVSAGTDVVVKSISELTIADGVYKIKVKDTADVETTYTVAATAEATKNLKAADYKAKDLLWTNIGTTIGKGNTDKYDLTLSVDGDKNVLFAKVLEFDAPVKIGAPVVNTVNKSIRIGTTYYVKKGDKDAKNLVIVKDGATVDYTALAENDVIMVAKNMGSDDAVASDDYFYIQATSKTVEGKLASAKPSSANATSVKVGDTSYDIGQFVVNSNDTPSTTGNLNVKDLLDKDVKVRLDPVGKVFSIDSATSTSADKFGVVLGTSYSNTMGDEVYQARILTAGGDKITYTVTDKDFKAAIKTASDGKTTTDYKLVQYFINSDGNLSKVDKATSTTDIKDGKVLVSKLNYAGTYVKSNVVVFVKDGTSSYKAIKWTDIDNDTVATADETFTDKGEYSALLLNDYKSTGTAGKYAYTTDSVAIADGKYIIDLVNTSGAVSLTTADDKGAGKGNAIIYTLGNDGKITITTSAMTKAAVTGEQKLTITEVASNRIKVYNADTNTNSYFYFTDDTIIVYDKDADGGSGVEKLTKADLYTDMDVEVYLTTTTNSTDIAVLVITAM